MTTGRGNRLTGQIGEYLVCAELGRRGFIATPFSGNVPTFDVLAADERCRTVPIQVKSSKSDTFPSDARTWMRIEFDPETGRQNYHSPLTIENADLIYVCVIIAAPGGRDRFFILTKADLQHVCIDAYSKWMDPKDWKRSRNPSSFDNRYSTAGLQRFEDNWQLISKRLEASVPDQALTADED